MINPRTKNHLTLPSTLRARCPKGEGQLLLPWDHAVSFKRMRKGEGRDEGLLRPIGHNIARGEDTGANEKPLGFMSLDREKDSDRQPTSQVGDPLCHAGLGEGRSFNDLQGWVDTAGIFPA